MCAGYFGRELERVLEFAFVEQDTADGRGQEREVGERNVLCASGMRGDAEGGLEDSLAHLPCQYTVTLYHM